MKLSILKNLSIKRRQIFFFFCLMILSMNVFSQTKVGETCETKLQKAQTQLKQERAAKQIALDSIKEYRISMQNLQYVHDSIEIELIDISATLYQTEIELQNALLKIEILSDAQKNEAERKLKESYETKLKALETEKTKAQSELQKTKQELNELEKKNNKLTATINEVQRTFPFKVTDIQFQNTSKYGTVLANYGDRLFSKTMGWLTAKMYFTGLVETQKEVLIRIKLFKPNGSLWKDSNTSTTYSTNGLYVTVNSGNWYLTINQWIKKGKSFFPSGKFKAGEYRMEIWYNDVCLGTHTFRVY